jgi:hypothetical protein
MEKVGPGETAAPGIVVDIGQTGLVTYAIRCQESHQALPRRMLICWATQSFRFM